MNLPAELEFERPTVEEQNRRAVPGYMRRIRDIYYAVHDRFGEDGLQLIRDVSRNYGESIGNNVKRKRDLRGVAQVGRYLLRVFDMVSDDWEVTELTEDRLVIAVHRCPYPFDREEVCRAHTHMEQALVATLDDNLEHQIGKSIPRGDACCEHIVCKKGVSFEPE